VSSLYIYLGDTLIPV